jgi:hypothetical protein
VAIFNGGFSWQFRHIRLPSSLRGDGFLGAQESNNRVFDSFLLHAGDGIFPERTDVIMGCLVETVEAENAISWVCLARRGEIKAQTPITAARCR